MTVRPKLMMSVGIAVAGLGLIGAGAGATFTAQVAASTEITSGGVGLSLNGETGSDLHLLLEGRQIGSHFTPIGNDLVLKNTGTLDMASTFLSLTATGCDGGEGAALAQALHVKLTELAGHNDKAGNHTDKVIYDGALCSMAKGKSGQGFNDSTAHPGVGGQLPHTPSAGESVSYRLVIQPDDPKLGLPPAAQYASSTVNLVFSGFDY